MPYKSMSVLYVEDDDIDRENMSKTLSYFFGRVLIASNGLEALSILKNTQPDVLITDYVMPHLNGYELICEAKKIHQNLIIFITSSYTDQEKLLQCIPLGLADYLVKPISYKQLLDALNKALQKNSEATAMLGQKTTYHKYLKSLFVEGIAVGLTQKEIKLVEFLLTNRGQVLSKNALMLYLYGEIVDENILKNLIYRLRKKSQENVLQTIKNVGYLLK